MMMQINNIKPTSYKTRTKKCAVHDSIHLRFVLVHIYISTHRNTILYAYPLIVNSRVCLVLYTLSGYHAISRRLLSMMAHRKITFISMFLYFSLITFSMPQRTMLIKRMPKTIYIGGKAYGTGVLSAIKRCEGKKHG